MGWKNDEETWTYPCKTNFYGRQIEWLTITEHALEHGVSKDKIRKLINELKEEAEPNKIINGRIIFVEEIPYKDGKKYRLIFWFKNGAFPTNHLWIRNCYQCGKVKIEK